MPSPGASPWQEYKNSEGRVYWSHSVTKQSVWEKPDELKTPFETAIGRTQWKQYSSKGRPYYVHSVTKETKWDLPAELVELKEKVEAREVERERRRETGEKSPTPDSPTADRYNALQRYESPTERETTPEEVIAFPPGGFLTHEKAEEGFIYLLKREKVDETWTWDQTMRKIIMDPLYKALDTLAQKKAAFEKYTGEIVAERQAAKDARIARLRPVLHKFFANSLIKSFATTKTADKIFANDRHWREARPDERRLILDEYVTDMRRREEAEERELRKRNVTVLGSLVKTLDISIVTPWRAAHNIILSSVAFREDEDLQQVETIDILGVYDDYTRQLEQEHEEESRRLRMEKARTGRKAREGFKTLLGELEARGELTRVTKWKDTYRLVKDDPRYLAILGLPGSTALDLWMDAVDDITEEVERAAEKVKVDMDTKAEDLTQVEPRLRAAVYEMLHGRLVQAAADEARRADRKRRHRIDDLRYALKKVQRHIDLDMTFEEAKPHMRDLAEYKELDEEDRRTAFEKFIKRQRDKHPIEKHSPRKRPRLEEVEEGEI